MLGHMLRISLPRTVPLLLLATLGWPAIALANHHHIGGSGSGADPDADCLVWGYVVVDGGAADRFDGAAADADAADADASMSDAGTDADAAQPMDAATGDGGSAAPPGAVLVCLEHATMFGCDCATGPAAGDGWPRGAVALIAAMLIVARRRRSTASPRGSR